MKILKLIFFLPLIFILSCGQQFKEITPVINENNIKIKLEVLSEKPSSDKRSEFELKFTNTGDKDLARCVIKFDNKYEHQLGGLIEKTDDWIGKTETSLLVNYESITLVFSRDVDNYSLFGIKDENFKIPETIELTCLDGKVIWKVNI